MTRPNNDVLDLPDNPAMNDALREAIESPVESNGSSGPPIDRADEFIVGAASDKPPPGIPDELIDRLPLLLKYAVQFMDGESEKSVFLTTAFPVLTGAMKNALLRHGDGNLGLGLYSATFAPAASGKGALRWSRRLGALIDERLYRESDEQIRAFMESGEKGEPPARRSFYVASNSSGRAMVDRLMANGGHCVVCDSELLTAIQCGRNDWGYYRDLLLKAAHGEEIQIDRSGGMRIRIPDPVVSFAVTGTFSTFVEFFPSQEDGLFSRFLFFSFDGGSQWKSQRPSESTDRRDGIIELLSKQVDEMHATLSTRETPLLVGLSEAAWNRHDGTFSRLLPPGNDPFGGAVKRSGVAAGRIAAALAVLRAFDDGIDLATVERLTVDDADAETALQLVLIYFQHARYLASTFGGWLPPAAVGLTVEQQRLYAALSQFDTFTPRDAFDEAGRMDLTVSERTVERWITGGIPGIIKLRHGVYRVANLRGGVEEC